MDKIFVAIASYRDTECQWTIKDLFDSAAFPDRITVGICWQFDPLLDSDCFIEPYPRPNQVQVINVTLKETRGACWAKSKAISLASDEDYILLIDSHMRFAPGWDTEMIKMLQETGNTKAFLSSYPAGYDPPNQRRFSTPRLAPVKFFNRVMSQNSVPLNMPRPIESYLMAGGYLFCHREMIDQVPYDPHIYFIGEEIAHAARFFTHGWTGYTPHKCLIHHYYSRKTSTKHWDDEKDTWSKINASSYRRVRHLLGIERTSDPLALIDIENYGLGKIRSLAEFQINIGVNFNALVIDRKRHETLDSVEAAIVKPTPPKLTHEMTTLGVYTCRYGHFLLPKFDSYIGKSLMTYGDWIEGLNAVFASLFSAGSVVIEVGAGFGGHTIALARLAGSEGKVIAIEQSRRMIELLHANIALNSLDNVHIIHSRAGITTGKIQVNEPVFETEGNFGMVSCQISNDTKTNCVPVIQLDSQIMDHFDLLFVDTPGNVKEVIESASTAIALYKPILVLNADNITDARKTEDLLTSFGYKSCRYMCPLFETDNFNGKTENIFGGLRSNWILATDNNIDLHSSIPLS
ncbi:FkbM family methyltransferase [Rhodoferax sp.]|uniref:FkbM family methyltransferase n=1 Tax=Rhodoferax sp. TaxID=50421 RepID=UPI0026243647|nr:FkbM family methyltransferase [Rhodoferax sp.]MDD2920339.1 FkbM family methyltransferase [Rhodoferax sp.]